MKLPHSIFGVLSGALALMLLSAPLQADEKIKSRMVDCDKGQDPAAVLNQELGPQRLEMTLVGTCPGFTVTRDDVRIEGDDEYGCPATTASVDGTIRFEGVHRAVVACLHVTGEGIGIEAVSGSSVQVVDSSISDNTDFGIFLERGSDAAVDGSAISGNAIGISVRNGSNVIINGSDITNNYETGIETANATSVVVENYSTISNNEGGGIDAGFHSSVLIQESSITSNGNYGIKLAEDCGLVINPDVTISGNGYLSEFCDGADSCGLICGDTESSALVLSEIEDLIECTDFNE